jgi:hypothetical protein
MASVSSRGGDCLLRGLDRARTGSGGKWLAGTLRLPENSVGPVGWRTDPMPVPLVPNLV